MKLERAFWQAFYKLNRDRQPFDTGKQDKETVISRSDIEAATMLERRDGDNKPFEPAEVKAFLDTAISRVPIDNPNPWAGLRSG